MRLVFHPDVESEISSSYHWYQEQAKGLGDDFLTELESSYDAQFVNYPIHGLNSRKASEDSYLVNSHFQ